MRTRRMFSVGATLALAAATWLVPAQAAGAVERVSFHGYNADAIFRVEEGPVVTDIDVGVVTGRTRGEWLPGFSVQPPAASVSIEVHHGDDLVLQAFGVVALQPGEYSMDEATLTAAHVATIVPVTTASGDTFDVAVDVSWTAWGPYDQQVGGTTDPGVSVVRFIGKARSSMWATGSISSPDHEFGLTTDAGFIMKINYLDITIAS